jgi:EAL domain-containing protein (putative c-di-GMP-specific phosphodiesterase class I)/CheY-like chemotaxis protein
VVDDDPTVRQLLVLVLEEVGLRTVAADGGEAALAELASRPVAAVVLDQHMPGMDGLKTLRAIREMPEGRTVPVLFVSGDSAKEVRLQVLRAGATDFLIKPIDMDEFGARVEAQVALRARWQDSVDKLGKRADVVATIARLSGDLNPTLAARAICEAVSAGHDGAPAALYACYPDGTHQCLSTLHDQLPQLGKSSPILGSRSLFEQARSGPWIQRALPSSTASPDETALSGWACAPLWHGGTPLAVLVLGIPLSADNHGDPFGATLAAAVDYATVAVLHLDAALSGARNSRRRRDDLREILDRQAFSPVFQPVAALDTLAVVGYEAFTRFSDATPPGRRLAESAEVGLALELEMAMLASNCADTASLPPDVWVSVNLSPSLLASYPDAVAAAANASARPLIVQLTEHEPIEDYPAVRTALTRLGPRIRLSVADAGAGYASLRHLVDLHPDFLKIDRRWVSGIHHDAAQQALVAGLLGFARPTGATLIAEGVDTPEDLKVLHQLGVAYGQGFLFGAPLPAAEITQRA